MSVRTLPEDVRQTGERDEADRTQSDPAKDRPALAAAEVPVAFERELIGRLGHARLSSAAATLALPRP